VNRDHDGRAVSVGFGSLATVHDADCAEAQACVAALQMASNQGISRIILETDSMTTVKALQSNETDLCLASVIYREARDLIRLLFDFVQSLHIPRSCNRCAHELARLSLGWDPGHPYVWFDPLPSFVTDLVVHDSAEPSVNE
jgi:ribonuclease HI